MNKMSTATIVAGATAATLAAVLRGSITTARVVGSSMAPTLKDGQRLLVIRRRWRRPGRGDVVVFSNPRRPHSPSWLVKRVAAMAGDVSPIDQSVVPAGQVAVLGDGPESLDSRQLGNIEERSILGVVAHPRWEVFGARSETC